MIGGDVELVPGLADPAVDSQRVFRAVMWAMAKPGRMIEIGTRLAPPPPLTPAAAAIVLALADFETPIWLDPTLADQAAVGTYLRFHTGARIVADPAEATFAAIADPARMPPLAAFRQGTIDYPDRSATLLLQVEALGTGGLEIEGPGIDGRARLAATPLPADFREQWADNRSAFPCGVDLLLATDALIAALPRSSTIMGG